MKPATELLDVIQGAVQQLQEVEVPDTDAERVAAYSARVERQLFYWRRSVEASYLDRQASVPSMVAAVAMQDEVPQVQVLAELIAMGAVKVAWWKVDKYMTEHGVQLYPSELEKGASNGQ